MGRFSVLKLVNASGTTVANYSYNAWGEILSSSGTMAEINPLRYRSYYYDTETGFYYLQSRYYDPVTHRFINADSYASTGQGIVGTNMFAYCLNNPVIIFDSTGSKAYVVVGGASITLYTVNFEIKLEYKVLHMVDNKESYEIEVSALGDGVSISSNFFVEPIDISLSIASDGSITPSIKCSAQISSRESVAGAMNGDSLSIEVSIEGEDEILHCISLTVTARKIRPTLEKRPRKVNMLQAKRSKKVVGKAVLMVGGAIAAGLLVRYGAKMCRQFT